MFFGVEEPKNMRFYPFGWRWMEIDTMRETRFMSV